MKKRFTSTFKAQVVHELLKGEKTLSQISAEYGVAATQLSQWKSTALKGLPSLFEDDHKAIERVKADYERRICQKLRLPLIQQRILEAFFA